MGTLIRSQRVKIPSNLSSIQTLYPIIIIEYKKKLSLCFIHGQIIIVCYNRCLAHMFDIKTQLPGDINQSFFSE